ncbi:hypothetical protein KDAU_00920 [Dictyobacter aurantiacus]|uniref:Uncharacterized protein n=1 Tax=Dictyobacter aurantiacus TaxID=1936993 RepID=A0A401Z7D3_9CHLR|nr:hypothetical protein KDAU_00920 [Dictyobacter aurantiacus]
MLAILLHASIDACIPGLGSLRVYMALYVLYIVVALLIIIVTRGHLSYERYLHQELTSPQFGRGAPDHGS